MMKNQRHSVGRYQVLVNDAEIMMMMMKKDTDAKNQASNINNDKNLNYFCSFHLATRAYSDISLYHVNIQIQNRVLHMVIWILFC
jgi:hypothetical protein